jgi:hypothetical protein
VSDIFHEVEEEVRRERFEKLWKKYGDYAITAVAVVVIGIAGYKFWDRYETQQRMNASSAFNGALQAYNGGNAAAAASAFGDLAKTAPGGYATMARLAAADALYTSGNRGEAIALYKAMIAKDNSPIANVARIRIAWATIETAPKSELETLLAPLTSPTSAWRFVAREVMAYADYRAGATATAQREYETLAADTNAPPALRARVRAMATFIKAGGDKDFGTVPKPPVPVPAQPANPKGQTTP